MPRQKHIKMRSSFDTRTGEPVALLSWGKNNGTLTPEEMIDHGLGAIETGIASIIDAQLYLFAIKTLDATPADAQQLILFFQKFRQTAERPQARIVLPSGSIPLTEYLQRGMKIIKTAHYTEAEGMLAVFIKDQLKCEDYVIDLMLKEFRKQRGQETLDPDNPQEDIE